MSLRKAASMIRFATVVPVGLHPSTLFVFFDFAGPITGDLVSLTDRAVFTRVAVYRITPENREVPR